MTTYLGNVMETASKDLRVRTLFISLLLLGCVPVFSQTPSLQTRIIGSGEPVIVLKGFTSIDSSWIKLAEKLGNQYQFHLVTLPGMNGPGPGDSLSLALFKKQLLQYIVVRHLFRPVVIGQDMGAMIALWITGAHPYLFSGIICVDNLPVRTPLNTYALNWEQSKNPSYQIAHALENRTELTEVQLRTRIQKIAGIYTQNDRDALAIAQSLTSGATGLLDRFYHEVMAQDIAKNFPQMDLPVLVLSCAPSRDAIYQSALLHQYGKLPRKSLVIAPMGRFAVTGDPLWFTEQVKNFLVNGIQN